jgi:hypothetical protein
VQLPEFFPALTDERVEGAIALVHSLFFTNTFPSWPLAHPYRFIAHDCEINTIRGNKNRMPPARRWCQSSALPRSIGRLYPIARAGGVRLGELDEAKAAAPGRPRAATPGADDDPGGVGERPRYREPGQAFFLPLPRQPDGAVGRPQPTWRFLAAAYKPGKPPVGIQRLAADAEAAPPWPRVFASEDA